MIDCLKHQRMTDGLAVVEADYQMGNAWILPERGPCSEVSTLYSE